MIDNTSVAQAFQDIHTFVDQKLAELIPADPPAPPPAASYLILPTTVQLFGPVHTNGSASESQTTPKYIGAARTCSLHPLHFETALAEIDSAYVRVLWTPNTAGNFINIIHADNGPSNETLMGVIQGVNGGTPVVGGLWITDQLKALQAAGVMKHIGFMFGGNGIAATFYEVELQINFRIPVRP